ncbi:hypothetical protein EGJ27_10825 [Pseudomonas sp. v388]|uniref:hypothetical protein n=1 Tax=Pseudomonas sp. v388 TaxID=2479849 RepID=UPI000F7AEA4C|nr:hypothetical protein [Pseudomonas sp. v388]RRV07564.1 hypothetical protein EGJ27_10825 [Pseudomonas sp. v388]
MTAPKPTPTAEQARRADRQRRLEFARQNDPTLDPPEGEGVLGPIPGDPKYRWPKSLWGQALTMRVPASQALTAGDQLLFLLDADVLEQRTLVDPQNNPAEREYAIGADVIQEEREYLLTYRHVNLTGNTDYSHALPLYVDHTPPNDNLVGDAPGLPQEIINNGLTLAYLDTHPTVDITVPRSSDILAGDQLRVYWGPVGSNPRQDPSVPVATRTLTEAEAAPGAPDPVVGISSDTIKTLQDGQIAIVYRYVDRTGNLGQPSQWTEIFVDLDLLPAKLPAPEVPLASDGLIDRADAREGVYVVIPAPGYENQQPTKDKIEVVWEGVSVPPVGISTFPMEIFVDWPTLSAGGAVTKRTFKVSYNVVRGPARTPSAQIDITVDFTVAGIDPPPDPDPTGPDPVNDLLPLVVVKSREVPPVDNVLGPADKGRDATAEIPSNPVIATQKLRLYWGALTPFVDEVEITTEQPSDPITFTIPWAKIQEGGYDEKLPVYYSTWNGVNEQESRRTEVDVRIVDMIGLKDVEFPDRWMESTLPYPVINCCSLPWEGIRVQIVGDPANYQSGDTLTVSWMAYEDMESTVPIPGTEYEFAPVTLDDDTVANGFLVTVPYEDHIEPVITFGGARVTCVLEKASGQTGNHVTRLIVSRVLGAGLCTPEFPGVC